MTLKHKKISIPSAAIVIIGNEVLSGRTQDINSHWLSDQLNQLGVRVTEIRVVPDIEEQIKKAVNELRIRNTYLFTTGGIGPTHDDITSQSIAAAFDIPLVLHPEAHEILKSKYKDALNEARLGMAYMPEKASLIANPISAAPGFRMDNVFVFAGVPKIMQAMFDKIQHLIASSAKIFSKTIEIKIAEGDIAVDLGRIQSKYKEVEIGSYPNFESTHAKCSIVLRSTKPNLLEAALADVRKMIRSYDS